MKPPVQYAMMPPRIDAPKIAPMRPVQQPKIAKMRGIDEALDYYLGPTGIPDKLRAVNSMFNPVEAVGGSMRASQRLFAPETDGWGRVQALGDMLSGVGGFVAPMVAASKVGGPVANAVVDAFTGMNTAPATQAAKATATDFALKDAGTLRYRRDASDIFGAGTTRAMYDDPATGGYMEMLERPNGPASTLELFVPEDMRGQGGGKRLLDEVMQNSPRMMGQVSSKAAAKTAYDAGRRPADMPNATLDDVFRMIDEDSSVNLMSQAELAARGILPPVAPMKPPGIKAYHGSPHSFDKFSMDAIGTGEGAQAYGHGLYFAENEGIARGYRDALSDPDAVPLNYKGRPVNTPWNADIRERWADEFAGLNEDDADAMEELLGNLSQVNNLADVKNVLDGVSPRAKILYYQRVKKDLAKPDVGPGSMYEVNINADPADFLDWDKPLSEMSSKVRQALGWTPETEAAYGAAQATDDDALLAALNGDASYSRARLPVPKGLPPLSATGADIAKGGSIFDRGSDVVKAAALKEKGIPGIKYLDAGSRGAGDGSRNYVVFDDKMIEIIKKYGIAGLMMGGAGMMQPNQAQAGQ